MDRKVASRHRRCFAIGVRNQPPTGTRTRALTGTRQRRRNTAAALSVGAVGAGLLLSACTTVTYNCSNSTCEVSLRGEGASSDLGGDRFAVSLVSVDDGVATIDLAGEQGSCSSGETIDLAQASVECTEVSSDGVDLTIIG